MARLAVGVGASIDGIAQHLVDGVIAGIDPADLRTRDASAVGKRSPSDRNHSQTRRAEPDSAKRAKIEAIAVWTASSGWSRTSPSALAPDQSDRQAAAEFSARRLVADAAVEASTKDMELRFAHRALQAEQEAIVEQRRVIHAVRVANRACRTSRTGR